MNFVCAVPTERSCLHFSETVTSRKPHLLPEADEGQVEFYQRQPNDK